MSVDRFAETSIEQRGTPESVWATAPRFPALDWSACSRLVVVAPHPDDEVLGVGGWAARLQALGIGVSVISVTDGGASHPGSPTVTPTELVDRRRRESVAALAVLGIDPPRRLGFEDGGVAQHEPELRERLAEELAPQTSSGTWCAVPLRIDGHPDHEAVGRATWSAATDRGMTVVEYPIWMWHWSRPDDASIPWDRARSVDLTSAEQARKRAATTEYRSQIGDLSSHPADRAILPPWVLDRLLRGVETVFV